MEFGGVLLSKGAAWLPVCCMRTSVVNELPGGISQLAACILDDIFNSSKANPEMLGVQLQGPDEKLYRLRFTLGCFLQHGLAHKMLFSVKGDNGTRCCILRQNVLAKGVELETATLAEVFCQERDLVLSTDADFSRSIATMKMKQQQLGKGDFNLWQQAAGITYNPAALVFQPSLENLVKPVSQWMHDWMHCFFQKGIWFLGFALHALIFHPTFFSVCVKTTL